MCICVNKKASSAKKKQCVVAAFNTYLKAVMQIFHGAVALAHHELLKNLIVIVTTFAQNFGMEVKDSSFIRAIISLVANTLEQSKTLAETNLCLDRHLP